MSLKDNVKKLLRPAVKYAFDKLNPHLLPRLLAGPQFPEQIPFGLYLLNVARSLAASGDHRIILPTDEGRPKTGDTIKIGYFGNIANNAYNAVKCMRRLGYDAELVVEDGSFDTFLMSRPFWEDVEVECDSYEDGLKYEYLWKQPHYVRRVSYDPELQAKYQGRYSAIPEVQALYKEAFNLDLPADKALLLAQYMGHWPYLLAMQRYDVVQFSAAPISMGIFCPKPYVVFPTGGDLFISPFEENVFGLLMRAGYVNARHILYPESNYPEYLDRIASMPTRSFAPMIIDTDTYHAGLEEATRAKWETMVGGKTFILSLCRQSWQWKGNDRLIEAFAKLVERYNDYRLVLLEWGPDIDRTKMLIASLKIENMVIWEKLSSKPVLRRKQRAADIVVDQVVMEGYGTSVLESMAAAKPVIVGTDPSILGQYCKGVPPFLTGNTPEQINNLLTSPADFTQTGKACREWVEEIHGYKKNAVNNFIDYYVGNRKQH